MTVVETKDKLELIAFKFICKKLMGNKSNVQIKPITAQPCNTLIHQ